MDKVTLKKSVTYDIAEHEVLLSFNNDQDAYAFDDWWISEGEKAFIDWHNNQTI